MKFLMSRGPNWEDASVKATNVTENTVPATPIMPPDMVDKMLRAESELLTKKNRTQPTCEIVTELSSDTSPMDNAIENAMMSTGRNQNVDVISFQ